jgi:hypothetical protein
MPVVGASPVTFISETTAPGKQYQIPLSAITITNGVATCQPWITAVGVTGKDQSDLIPALFRSLVAHGLITAP